MGDGFYRSKDPTNSIKVLKEATSQIIADFVPNFVAIATGVGRGRICLASFNSPTPKTPLYAKISGISLIQAEL